MQERLEQFRCQFAQRAIDLRLAPTHLPQHSGVGFYGLLQVRVLMTRGAREFQVDFHHPTNQRLRLAKMFFGLQQQREKVKADGDVG